MAYQSVNPANGEILRRFDQHTDEQMQSALATADSTYQHIWSKTAPIPSRKAKRAFASTPVAVV